LLGIEGLLDLCVLKSLHLGAQHQDFIYGIVKLVACTTRDVRVLNKVGRRLIFLSKARV
jgi:hypothetical protein